MRDGIISEQMKSRLIKAGLPATYEELVALAADTGIPADILFNEEGWQQLPTYLSKANLLSDATEVAIWETAQNRTVNDALKMLADVAYGRVASLTLTINDTDGNPIPDVTVRLDSAPTVGEDPITGTDGKIKLDTNAGEHTVYLVYPLGYSAETESKTVQVTGNTATTVASVSRKDESTVFNLTESKAFYIARFLSPIQIDIRGGGGSGCLITFADGSTSNYRAKGGAGGYVNIQTAVDVVGKVCRAYVGAGGISNGGSGGTTTLIIGETAFTASGGAGGTTGKSNSDRNENGGAYGGAGKPASYDTTAGYENGEDGRFLFDDPTLTRKGAGGGGAYSYPKNEITGNGTGGSGGGTRGQGWDSSGTDDRYTPDATNASGSGALATPVRSNSGTVKTGKGGPGFVAFRKAV